jgi:adenylate kinase family enzyme
MIYLIGGAPRAGKSILAQSLAAKRNIGWVSTDLLIDLLRLKGDEGAKANWNAAPEAIGEAAKWFFPPFQPTYLGRRLGERP